jgi:hypothetical protein
MDSSDRTARIAMAIAFVGTALVFWHSFEVFPPITTTALRDPTPAGEIVKGFEIQQTVVPPTNEGLSEAQGGTCFGLRFATYRRKNSGTFTVKWTQDNHREQWLVAVSDLADNAVRYFCPDQDMRTGFPFTISVSGKDATTGSAPTVWLTRDTSLGRIEGRPDGRALALRVTGRMRVAAPTIAQIRHHTFLVSWCSTLLIGLVAIMVTGSARRRHQTNEPESMS